MKRLILDVSDCAESPLSPESRAGRRFRRTACYETGLLEYSKFQPREKNPLHGLTEEFFSGKKPELLVEESTPSAETENPSLNESEEAANWTYQSRCAHRWWGEVRRWFGPQG